MKFILTLFSLFLFISIGFSQSYQSAESAEYDPSNNRWLVSNGSSIISDDGAGNLSFFSPSGASFGMEVLGDYLYAIAGTGVRVFDISTEAVITNIPISGAGFLNGMTNDGVSTIYVTDFGNDKIYRLNVSDIDNPVVTTIVNDTGSQPNGIVFDEENNRLVFVSWGSNATIKAVDLTDNSVSTITTTSLGNIDGIDRDAAGNYYIASWTPARISKFDKDFANPIETISTPFISQPADIGYSTQNDTLAIPVGNNVVFVGFDSPVNTVDFFNNSKFDISVFPNPISHQSYITFHLPQTSQVKLNIIDQQGQHLRVLINGQLLEGDHKVLFTGHDLPAGVYYLQLQVDDLVDSEQIIVIR